MEPVQIVILIVIVVLTILLAALGVQVFFILREIRRTIEKANKVLDDAGVITESIATPVSTLSSLAMSIKTGVSFAGWIKKTYEHLINHLPHKETKDQQEKQTHLAVAFLTVLLAFQFVGKDLCHSPPVDNREGQ